MARQIKFRGFDIVGNKGWVYGDLTHTKGLDNSKKEFLYDRVMIGGYEVDPESVGECTGLLDKQNNPIYEGDILRQEYGSTVFEEEVVWLQSSAGFVLDGRDGTYSPIVPDNVTIIGNKYKKEKICIQ